MTMKPLKRRVCGGVGAELYSAPSPRGEGAGGRGDGNGI